MKHNIRPTAGVSREQWRRMVVTRSLQMMVRSGVLRRAELDPPLDHHESAKGGPDGQEEDQPSAGDRAESGWLARIFLSREFLLRRQH